MKTLIPFVTFFSLLCSISPYITSVNAEVADDDANAASADILEQRNILEFLPTLSNLGDATQKLLDIAHSGIENVNQADFWSQAESLGTKLQVLSESLMEQAKSRYKDASGRIDDAKSAMNDLVSSASELSADLTPRLKEGDTIEQINKDIEKELTPIVDKFRDLFPVPEQDQESPEQEPHRNRDERERVIRELLAKIEEVMVRVGVRHGIDEEVIRKHAKNILSHFLKVMLLIGDISEQHPTLLSILVWGLVGLVIPQARILSSILNLFGFGPAGVVGGSAAAWAQRFFFGGLIPRGSWFALLQRAGMTAIPEGMKVVAAGVGMAAGAAIGFFRNITGI